MAAAAKRRGENRETGERKQTDGNSTGKKWWDDPGDAAGGTASETAQPTVALAGLVGKLLWDRFPVKK
jgi:hypothetical protein